MRIVSWNVNGLRAVLSRGDLDWAFAGDVDVVCLQETKIQPDHVTDAMRHPPGYSRSFWSFHATKKGYSGTAIFVKDGLFAEAFSMAVGGAEHPEYDREGRVVGVDLGACVLFGVYFPNGGSSDERLAFKHAWHDAFLDAVVELQQTGRHVVIAGDFNVAHTDLDLAKPKEWAGVSGCLPVERAWFDRLLSAGFVDSFRAEKGDLPRQFTFWETRVDARSENLGWRIDYIVIPAALEEQLVDAWISPQIFGSDHCPVGVELDLRGAPRADAVADDIGVDDVVEDEDEDEDGGSRWRR
jgi:exodeoxyribonuclease-3